MTGVLNSTRSSFQSHWLQAGAQDGPRLQRKEDLHSRLHASLSSWLTPLASAARMVKEYILSMYD